MSPSSKADFIEHYSKEQKKIFLFILSMVHNKADAEELMQQTAMDMWKMFERFQKGTSFAAWGCTIAKYRILDYRKKQQKNRLFLSPEVYEQVMLEMQKSEKESDKKKDALQGCLKKLKDSDLKMLMMHYEDDVSYKNIAEKLKVSKTGIYKVMTRIHMNLQKCIRQTLVVWDNND